MSDVNASGWFSLIYLVAIVTIAICLSHFGMMRCQFCRKFRMDGHKKDCPRYKAPKERTY